MIKGQPSRTALLTCVQRAHHYLAAPEPKVLYDDMALSLSGLGSEEAVYGYIDKMVDVFASLSDIQTGATLMARIEGAVCMRSRVVEERLVIARERGVTQLVILGAGLDSTAYRCLTLTEGVQVFEVDHPATQQWKREQLQSANIAVPNNLTFVAFDFEQQTLTQALQMGGIDKNKPALFTWLGVQFYLSDEAVRSTLSVLGQYPKGSEIVMDFISPSYVRAGKVAKNSVNDLQEVVLQMGEPVKSKYYMPELEEILTGAGFTEVTFHNSQWLVDNYLGGSFASYAMPPDAISILTAQI